MNHVIDDDEILEYVIKNYVPEDVFAKRDLDYWAINNGYVEEAK